MAIQMTTVHMHSIILCIICIYVCLSPVYGSLLVFNRLNTGSTNFLEYKNGSMGNQTSGMVSNNREEVWLYEYSWPEKIKVNHVNSFKVNKLQELILI